MYYLIWVVGHQIRNMKKDDYIARKQIECPDKIIPEDSEETYKTPQVLIDQLWRLFFAGKFSEQIVKEQIETVLIAGNETSALTLSYTIILLAMYPDIQERLYRELRLAYDTQDEETSYERIQRMPYLDCVLKESMRLFPVAPFIVRTAIADTPISNCVIPKGAIIMMSIFNVQRVSNTHTHPCQSLPFKVLIVLNGNGVLLKISACSGPTYGETMLKRSIRTIGCRRRPTNGIRSASCRSAAVPETVSAISML